MLKITFGMIVLNGEPFTKYNLRALYPFAYQIIVVEGACPSAAAVATKDGHSIDGTVKSLCDFKEHEDFEGKLTLVTAESEGHTNGFWSEKDEMSRAYARRATGNYLWQVDSDEFYHEEDLKYVCALLSTRRPDAISFPMLTFFGGLRYVANSFYLIRDNAREYHRIFAWGKGYTYVTHRPPTVLDSEGVDTRRKRWIRASELERKGVHLYHYSLLFPQQVSNKVSYYKNRVSERIENWERSVYQEIRSPFRVHNVDTHVGWLERFEGEHPQSIMQMMNDIANALILAQIRDCTDIEKLLSNRWYSLATKALRACAHLMALQPFNFVYRAIGSTRLRIKRLTTSLAR